MLLFKPLYSPFRRVATPELCSNSFKSRFLKSLSKHASTRPATNYDNSNNVLNDVSLKIDDDNFILQNNGLILNVNINENHFLT